MADPILCGGRACYTDIVAVSIGYGVNDDGILLKHDGTFWHKSSDSTSLVDTGTTYINRASVGGFIPSLSRYYDSNSLTKYTWENARIFCTNKGWLLPLLSETSLELADGAPFLSGNTWSNSYRISSGNAFYYSWNATTWVNNNNNGDLNYVRCIK